MYRTRSTVFRENFIVRCKHAILCDIPDNINTQKNSNPANETVNKKLKQELFIYYIFKK